MRIVSVCRGYPTHKPGGMLFVVQDRAEALVALGHEVHVVTTGYQPVTKSPGKGPTELNGVHLHHLDCNQLQYTDRFATECVRKVKELKPDILHLDSFDPQRLWWTELNPRPRTAVTMHGMRIGERLTSYNRWMLGQEKIPGPPDALLEREARALRECFDRVIAISQWERLQLLSMYNVPRAKVRFVYNPIAPYFYSTPRKPPPTTDFPKFLCVAVSGHDHRNFSLAMSVAEEVGYMLEIVKDKPRTEMPEIYDNAHGLIIPTTYAKGFDLTFAEALARQRPVICSTSAPYLLEAEGYQNRYDSPFPVCYVNMGSRADLQHGMRIALEGHAPGIAPPEQHKPEYHAKQWLWAVE